MCSVMFSAGTPFAVPVALSAGIRAGDSTRRERSHGPSVDIFVNRPTGHGRNGREDLRRERRHFGEKDDARSCQMRGRTCRRLGLSEMVSSSAGIMSRVS
jgi:hypothetical protein